MNRKLALNAMLDNLVYTIYIKLSICNGGHEMFVKARKVGNSFALTIPASIVEAMKIQDGLELKVDYNPYSGTLS